MDPSIIAACIAAAGSISAVVITTRNARRSRERHASTEEERLHFDVWRESVEELRTIAEELRTEVADCHRDRDALADELGGMREANRALRMRMAVLEDQVAALTRKGAT